MTSADLRRLLPEFRTKVIGDLIVIVLVALLAWLSVGVLRADVDMRAAHIGLTLVTVAVVGAVAVVAVIGERTARHHRSAWLGAAFGVYALAEVAPVALGPRTLDASPALLALMTAGNLAVAALLLFWAARALPAGGRRTWRGATAAVVAVVIVALGVADARVPAVSTVLGLPVVQVLVALAWAGAAARGLATGLDRRDLSLTRVGLGLALLTFAEMYRAGTGAGVAAPDLLASALQLVGALAVLGGVVGRHRGDVSSLLSERERQQAALHDALRQVERVATMAAERDHELANGLAGLAGIAYLLGQPAATPDGAELWSAVLAEIARLHGMLALRDRAGDGSFDVAGALSELAVLRRAAGMRIDLDVDGGLVAVGGRDAFAQAVTNLLTNCERHAPGSPVRLHAYGDGGRVVVEVHDEGPGVQRGREQAVLERGVTGGATGGSGLGLHVSARLVRERGGDLRVLARGPDERGFGVRLELPRQAPAPAGELRVPVR